VGFHHGGAEEGTEDMEEKEENGRYQCSMLFSSVKICDFTSKMDEDTN
jgi:hypothetical protein